MCTEFIAKPNRQTDRPEVPAVVQLTIWFFYNMTICHSIIILHNPM